MEYLTVVNYFRCTEEWNYIIKIIKYIITFYVSPATPDRQMNRQEERKMTVTIAGKKKEIAEKTTIAQIIVSENVENPDYVTVTVNDEFVDSDAFATTELKDGDTVEFLYFMGGGSF